MADKPPSSGLCVVFARVVAKEGKADELEKLLQAAVKSANSDKEPYTKTYRCARHGGESFYILSVLLVPVRGGTSVSDVQEVVILGYAPPAAPPSVGVHIRPANSGSRGLSRTDCFLCFRCRLRSDEFRLFEE